MSRKWKRQPKNGGLFSDYISKNYAVCNRYKELNNKDTTQLGNAQMTWIRHLTTLKTELTVLMTNRYMSEMMCVSDEEVMSDQ